jgi:hypothetical protein
MTATAPTRSAVAEPRTAGTVTPTPTAHELTGFVTAQANGTLPQPTWKLAMDGSAIDPHSFNPAPITTPSWP